MTQIFNEDGVLIPVTVLQAGPCVVTQIKTVEMMVTKQFRLVSLIRKKKLSTETRLARRKSFTDMA